MIEFVVPVDMVHDFEEQVFDTQQRPDTFIEGVIVTGHGLYAAAYVMGKCCSRLWDLFINYASLHITFMYTLNFLAQICQAFVVADDVIGFA
jgi:hypothetical protein